MSTKVSRTVRMGGKPGDYLKGLPIHTNPTKYNIIYDALVMAGREDLIGYGPKCLIRPKENDKYKKAATSFKDKKNAPKDKNNLPKKKNNTFNKGGQGKGDQAKDSAKRSNKGKIRSLAKKKKK